MEVAAVVPSLACKFLSDDLITEMRRQRDDTAEAMVDLRTSHFLLAQDGS